MASIDYLMDIFFSPENVSKLTNLWSAEDLFANKQIVYLITSIIDQLPLNNSFFR